MTALSSSTNQSQYHTSNVVRRVTHASVELSLALLGSPIATTVPSSAFKYMDSALGINSGNFCRAAKAIMAAAEKAMGSGCPRWSGEWLASSGKRKSR